MVRSKAPAKKQQKKGIDFKKIKRKLGRKLPPPKNATNTEVNYKAIVIPEQSVAAEKGDFATNKKGLTLQELLGQTRHHSAKVQKDALRGLKDLFRDHPTELQLHKNATVDKLKERINDPDKLVRDAFYELFKDKIFPACKEDQGPMVSLLMPSIFLAMAASSIDVRLMAFKFLKLVVEYYPRTFSLNAGRILEEYKDIFQKNLLNVQDKGKLEVALSGLAYCLSLLPCDQSDAESLKKASLKNETLFAYEQDAAKECNRFAHHISGRLKEIVEVLINCFQDFIPLINASRGLDEKSFDCIQPIFRSIGYAIKFSIRRHIQRQKTSQPSSEEVTLMILSQDTASMLTKKLLVYFPLNPEVNLSRKGAEKKFFILNSLLTEIFLEVNEWIRLPTNICDKFLEFIENTLLGKITRNTKPVQEKTLLKLLPFLPRLILRMDRDWRDNLLQAFTITFNDCKPESSVRLACISVIRDMIIPNGDILYPSEGDSTVYNYQSAWVNKLPSLLNQLGDKHPLSTQAVLKLLLDVARVGYLNPSPEFEESIRHFFTPCHGEGDDVPCGPFVSLSREAQELALCFLYYFTIGNFSSPLLKSIVSYCLYPQLEPDVLYRTVEVLHTAYRAGYIQITDHFCFLITLIARFKVLPEEATKCDEQETNLRTLKTLTNLVCSCLSEMGDSSLILQILEKALLEQIILKPAMDNGCAILGMICVLDSKPSKLSENSLTALSEFLPGYLIDIVNCIPEDKEDSYRYIQTCLYYLLPCFFLFDRSSKLTEEVLKRMRLMVSENTKALESVQDRESGRNSLSLIQCVVSVILLMHNDDKVRKIISSSKSEIDLILDNVISLQSSESTSMTVEGKHMMKIAGERLKIASKSLLS